MRQTALLIVVVAAACGLAVGQDNTICVRHIELSGAYAPLARAARIQGTVNVELRISPTGKVVSAKATSPDRGLQKHPILQDWLEKKILNWTFQCLSCKPGMEFEHRMTFIYRLTGGTLESPGITMDLPSKVTIVEDDVPVETQTGSTRKR